MEKQDSLKHGKLYKTFMKTTFGTMPSSLASARALKIICGNSFLG